MARKNLNRKKPCGICRRWFLPDVRVGERQKTCSNPACQRERHRRNCQESREQNQNEGRETQWRRRLRKDKESGPFREPREAVQWEEARDEIGVKVLVVIDEFVKLSLVCLRDEWRAQLIELKGKSGQLIPKGLRDESRMAGGFP